MKNINYSKYINFALLLLIYVSKHDPDSPKRRWRILVKKQNRIELSRFLLPRMNDTIVNCIEPDASFIKGYSLFSKLE